MKESRSIKDKLLAGHSVIGTMIVQVRTPVIVQLFVEYGFDFIVIDTEHGPYNFETIADLILVARLSGIAPLVRVGETRYHLYSLALDMGAQGVISPRVDTVEQIRAINQSIKYPPQGIRGFSRLAAHINFTEIDFSSYVHWANQKLLNIIQIESKSALENLDDLLSEPGVDGVLVGVDDLALSLCVPGDTSHPVVEKALYTVSEACQKRRMFWGLHSPDVERLIYWMERGMSLVLYSSDIWMLQKALRQDVKMLKTEQIKF